MVRALQIKLIRDLKYLKSQIVSVALLLVVGLSVFVSSWSSYQSLNDAKDYFYDQYQFADLFSEFERAPESIISKILTIPGVEVAESRIVKEGLVNVDGVVEPALGKFISWSERKSLNQVHLIRGAFPRNSFEIEAIAHEAFFKAHRLSLNDHITVSLGGHKRKVRVVGVGISPDTVYALNPSSPLPDDKHFGIFWFHERQIKMLLNMEDVFNSLLIRLERNILNDSLKMQLLEVLSPYGAIEVNDRNQQVSHIFVEDEITQQKVTSILMPAIFMSVALFILNIILSRMISFHRPQIASLKALGYHSRDLFLYYLKLVTVILLCGILPSLLVGAFIGSWYSDLYKDFFRFPRIDFSISWEAVGFTLFFGLLPGWMSSFYALKAVLKLNPAEALRPPSPPDYRKTLVDKIFFREEGALATKMTIRSLFFKPLRLILILFGLALSLAILVNASFWGDVIDSIIYKQFQEMQREDLTVTLSSLKKVEVLKEVEMLEGVIKAEGERLSPAFLILSDQSKEILIKTFEPSMSLNQFKLLEQVASENKNQGVILSEYFQREFGIQRGDSVMLKMRLGAQQVFRARVIGFVGDVMGHIAYIESRLFSQLIHEPILVNSLKIKADPQMYQSLFVALKEKPTVVNISVRRSVIQSFNSLVSDMILTFTSILYVFALAIAGAVILNSAHAIFVEKSWELASLRILGFSLQKTFEVVFFEIALQIIVIIVPGLMFGYFLSWMSTRMIQNENFVFPFAMSARSLAGPAFAFLLTFFVSSIYLYRKVLKLDFTKALKARE